MYAYNFISMIGILALLAIAWTLSADRRRMNFRVILWGVGLQLLLAFVVFRAPGSTKAFKWFNRAVIDFFHAAMEGNRFVFGPLADGEKVGFILGIQALPAVIFFSALMGLLYYWRIMPLIIRGFAWLFTKLMRISGAESLCAASNIFVGVESATAVRPHLGDMTRSELTTILTAGMATVASSTLFIYVSTLQEVFPTIAGHLISASILSAPAAIVMSKVLVPETHKPATLGLHVELHYQRESGAIEAIMNGATAGVKLVVGIVAMLIAFLGLVGVVNLILGALGFSLQGLLAYVMWPLAVLIGVPPADAMQAGAMLGERLIVTEIPAYNHLASAMKDGLLSHPRTAVVLAYALCGFAHVASLAIFVGGIAALVPDRRRDLAAVGPRALLAATLACLMTGAVAGAFYHPGAMVLQTATQAAP